MYIALVVILHKNTIDFHWKSIEIALNHHLFSLKKHWNCIKPPLNFIEKALNFIEKALKIIRKTLNYHWKCIDMKQFFAIFNEKECTFNALPMHFQCTSNALSMHFQWFSMFAAILSKRKWNHWKSLKLHLTALSMLIQDIDI